MKRLASAAALALSVLAVAGCGGSSGTDSPTVAETIAREVATAPTTTAATAPPTTTAERSSPTTTSAEPSRRTTTSDDQGPGPVETARMIAAAYERQDLPAFCAFFGRRAMAQLRTGAANSGTASDTCPKILRNVLGKGMVLEPLDVSGDPTIDGDRATVGEISLVLEDGEWKLAEGM